jgi:diaminopimelate decarboxylase
MQQYFDAQRRYTLVHDRRFCAKKNHLHFDNVDLHEIAAHYPSPLFIYSASEIHRNIEEIRDAFKDHPNTKICYAMKACSLLEILRSIRDAGICVDANSANEIRRCLAVGFKGSDIVYNGVVKRTEELEFAIQQKLHAINVDSEYELEQIDAISRRLKIETRVCIRVEPNVKASTHEGLITAYRAKSGVDLAEAKRICFKAMHMPFVKLCGLHMHVGDQVPNAQPFRDATRVLVNSAREIEQESAFKFEMINVGGGIPTPYRYQQDQGNGGPENMQPQIGAREFAQAIISEVHQWRRDVEICIEPGRKIVGSAAVMLTRIESKKHKTLLSEDGKMEGEVDWRMLNAGFNHMPDYKDWYFYVYNASRVDELHDQPVRLGGPLCDGGDYFRHGPAGENYLIPAQSDVGDVLAFLDVGAYQLENQTVYNGHPRAAVAFIDHFHQIRLIRRQETFEEMLSLELDANDFPKVCIK